MPYTRELTAEDVILADTERLRQAGVAAAAELGPVPDEDDRAFSGYMKKFRRLAQQKAKRLI